MAVSFWNGFASKTMFSEPTAISPRFSFDGFLPASFMTTSRIFFDFSAKFRISSKRRKYSHRVLFVSPISLSKVSAISCADLYSYFYYPIILHLQGGKQRKGKLRVFFCTLTLRFQS